MKTTWKKWRVGLWLAIGVAILSAGAGVASDMSWRQFVALLCSTLLSGVTGYLSKSPLEDVEDAWPEVTTGSIVARENREQMQKELKP